MTAEKLSEFRQMFEDCRKYDKKQQLQILDLEELREAISLNKCRYDITDEEFRAFFGDYLTKQQVIDEQDFSGLVSKYEEELFNSAGIVGNQESSMFDLNKLGGSPSKQRGTDNTQSQRFSGEYFTRSPDDDSSQFSEKQDTASKQVFLEYMSAEQKDPEITL